MYEREPVGFSSEKKNLFKVYSPFQMENIKVGSKFFKRNSYDLETVIQFKKRLKQTFFPVIKTVTNVQNIDQQPPPTCNTCNIPLTMIHIITGCSK